MSTKRNYRRCQVKDVSSESLKDVAITKGGTGTTVGLDVAKGEVVAVVRWPERRQGFRSVLAKWHGCRRSRAKGLVAMMRKLCKSLWYVYDQDEAFSYSKVFPGKPLQEPRSRTRRRRADA
jgi:hypothetical protein